MKDSSLLIRIHMFSSTQLSHIRIEKEVDIQFFFMELTKYIVTNKMEGSTSKNIGFTTNYQNNRIYN